MRRDKKGIVLFVTLMLIMLLLGLVNIFLKHTKESKDFTHYSFAINQTNSILYALVDYLKDIKLDPETVFYASKIPYPLAIDNTTISIEIDSAQNKLDINSLIRDSIKNNRSADKLVTLFIKYDIKEPELLLRLFQDTIDKDNDNRAFNTEIIVQNPTFRNDMIYNKSHFHQILEYYYLRVNDKNVFLLEKDNLFSFRSFPLDLNFLSRDVLEMLLDDANEYGISMLAKHEVFYEKFSDLPFDEAYIKKLESKSVYGQSLSVVTNTIKMSIIINYKNQFNSDISILYNYKSKKIVDYSIDKIVLISKLKKN